MKQTLYHGSITPGIKRLEPRKRYTPRALGENVPPSVYAGDNAFYCIAHALPWTSKEGFDLFFDETDSCVFRVPSDRKDFLNQKVYLYTVPKDKFTLLPDVSPKGHNYRSLEAVDIIKEEEFSTVIEAAEKLGGKIKYK